MKEYLTEKQLYDIQCAIYNDDNKALLKALPEVVDDKIEGEVFQFLTKDCNWAFIKDTEYIITENGIVFHSRHQRILKIVFSAINLTVNIKGRSYNIKDIFQDNGWTYNRVKIIQYYRDNNYELHVPKLYKELYAST